MNKHERGFGLIEIVIAVALFTVLSIGLYKAAVNYLNTVKMHSEFDRVKQMSNALNVDLLNGTMPNSSNLSGLLQQGAEENIVANNFSKKYYLVMTSPLSSMQTSNLCNNINSLPSGSTFSVQLLNGNVINNVIYLLISPTGKGENTLQLNNLPSPTNNVGNLITVQPGSTITLSPFDIVRYETVSDYTSFCINDNNPPPNSNPSSSNQCTNANTAGCYYVIDNDSSMSAVANMNFPNGATICIEPGNYNTPLILSEYGGTVTLTQICNGQINVPSVTLNDGTQMQVNNVTLQTNSFFVNNGDNYYYYVANNGNPIVISNSTITVSGTLIINNIYDYSFLSLVLSNSTLAVAGGIYTYPPDMGSCYGFAPIQVLNSCIKAPLIALFYYASSGWGGACNSGYSYFNPTVYIINPTTYVGGWWSVGWYYNSYNSWLVPYNGTCP